MKNEHLRVEDVQTESMEKAANWGEKATRVRQ